MHKLQALVYDILPSWRKVPESDARSVGNARSRFGLTHSHATFFLLHLAMNSIGLKDQQHKPAIKNVNT